MAYGGFISDPEYTRRTENETISGEWLFKSTTTFEKAIRGTTLSTYYGDLAEYYEYDSNELLPEGTLVKFGGTKEITKTKTNDRCFFGVISSNPGVSLNNSGKNNYAPVALCGKIPCRTNGKIKKFDKLTTSSVVGVAKKKTFIDTLLGKPTIGVSLEDKNDNSEKLINIFVRANF